MKLGIGVTNFSWPCPPDQIGPIITRIATTADTAGVDSIWTMDHFFQTRLSGLPPESPMLEAYATLAFIAGRTQRIRLGTLVTAVPNRHPGVLIKAVTSLDVLTGGRMVLGIGAGAPFTVVHEGEAGGLGIPYPPTLTERYECLEEVLQIAHQMWRGDEQPFRGRHYQLDRPLNSPNALQRPHPPILIGGSGERRTLRLVAQYGDACNLFDIPDGGQTLRRKFEVLAEHCATVGRCYEDIERTVTTVLQPDESTEQLVDRCRTLNGLGVDHVVLIGRGRPWQSTDLDTIARTITQLTAA